MGTGGTGMQVMIISFGWPLALSIHRTLISLSLISVKSLRASDGEMRREGRREVGSNPFNPNPAKSPTNTPFDHSSPSILLVDDGGGGRRVEEFPLKAWEGKSIFLISEILCLREAVFVEVERWNKS